MARAEPAMSGFTKPVPSQILSALSLAALDAEPSLATDTSDACSEWSCCVTEASEFHEAHGLKSLQQMEQCCEDENECNFQDAVDEGSTTAVSGDESFVSASTGPKRFLRDISSESETEEIHQQQSGSLKYTISRLLQYRGVPCAKPVVCYGTRPVRDITGAHRANRTEVVDRSAPKSDDDKYVRMIRAALADISADRLEVICQKIAARGVKNPTQFATVVSEIFSKAFAKHHLVPACVDLCMKLKTDPRFEGALGADGGPHSFRQCLLDQCWPTFEQLMSAQTNDSTAKRSALGVVKLIGELILRGLVSPRLVIECSEFILSTHMANNCILDCLATLIMAVGSTFDDPHWIHFKRFEQILNRMWELSRDSNVSAQARLILRDVLSLRESRWCRTNERALRENEVEPLHMLNLAKSALLAAPEAPNPTPVPNTRNISVIPLKKQLRSELKPARGSGTPADIPAGATGFFSGVVLNRKPGSAKTENLKPGFNPVAFHRELSVTLRQLSLDADVNKAVQRIASQNVPFENQEKEFADLLTRASEMTRDSSRRAAFALAAGIAAAEPGVFDRNACVGGLRVFFREVYGELCEEVPKLPIIVRTELLPALRSVFHYSTVDNTLPDSLR